MTAFDPLTLAADFTTVRQILANFVAARSPRDWDRKTERRAKGWTLHETLAHLTATAQTMYQATVQALNGRPISFPGIAHRVELADYNAREVAARRNVAPQTLAEQLFEVLDQCAAHGSARDERDLALTIPIPFYNRPLTVAEALGWQLMHPGLVHAAQLANGAGVAPLWVHYPPDLLHRQISRFFNAMSHSYWPERGRTLRADINFVVARPGGGRWYLTVDTEGGATGESAARRPALTVWLRSPDALCRLLTIQISPVGALLTGQMFAWGSLSLGFRIPYLFTPT